MNKQGDRLMCKCAQHGGVTCGGHATILGQWDEAHAEVLVTWPSRKGRERMSIGVILNARQLKALRRQLDSAISDLELIAAEKTGK